MTKFFCAYMSIDNYGCCHPCLYMQREIRDLFHKFFVRAYHLHAVFFKNVCVGIGLENQQILCNKSSNI